MLVDNSENIIEAVHDILIMLYIIWVGLASAALGPARAFSD
jgi:hypothetical protein